ncbi:hypothetical protein NDU88_007436 [Pleurodeles waltl]|uniref:Uncharacterized protein n=1 Tax=Pleurodeles waltl TaxID=8319 RepID=A0AAV7VSP5_PLEWA|nr:hypothetical protein NDU88_007436 [Pleurodeles waltl]
MKRGQDLAAEEHLQHGSTAAESNTCQQCAASRLSWEQHAKREARTCSRPRTGPGREERNQKWAWAGRLRASATLRPPARQTGAEAATRVEMSKGQEIAADVKDLKRDMAEVGQRLNTVERTHNDQEEEKDQQWREILDLQESNRD